MFTYGNMRGGSAVQRKTNESGFAQRAKAGVERTSGVSLDDVNVHFNSGEPRKYGALAFTRGTDVHIATGQERHLGHELGHVVQQKRGSVPVTMRVNGVGVNDSPALEREADRIGAGSGGVVQRREVVQFAGNRNVLQMTRSEFSGKELKNNGNGVIAVGHMTGDAVNRYGHSIVMTEGLKNHPTSEKPEQVEHWVKVADFYPDREDYKYTDLIFGVNGKIGLSNVTEFHDNENTDGINNNPDYDSTSNKFRGMSGNIIKSGFSRSIENLHNANQKIDGDASEPPIYKLFTNNCSSWAKAVLAKANVSASAGLFFDTPGELMEKAQVGEQAEERLAQIG